MFQSGWHGLDATPLFGGSFPIFYHVALEADGFVSLHAFIHNLLMNTAGNPTSCFGETVEVIWQRGRLMLTTLTQHLHRELYLLIRTHSRLLKTM